MIPFVGKLKKHLKSEKLPLAARYEFKNSIPKGGGSGEWIWSKFETSSKRSFSETMCIDGSGDRLISGQEWMYQNPIQWNLVINHAYLQRRCYVHDIITNPANESYGSATEFVAKH